MSEIKDKLSDKIIEIINIGKEYTFRAGLIPANQKSRLISAVKSFLQTKRIDLERTVKDNLTETCQITLNRIMIRLKDLENTLKYSES